jgi:hypothetical protein
MVEGAKVVAEAMAALAVAAAAVEDFAVVGMGDLAGKR